MGSQRWARPPARLSMLRPARALQRHYHHGQWIALVNSATGGRPELRAPARLFRTLPSS